MKPSVLIVDDKKSMLELLYDFLSTKGYEVLTADNAKKAIEIIRLNSPDIVISDIKMPEMSGIELLKEAKKFVPDIFIILMTAYGTIELAVKAMKAGAYDFITKPFELSELASIIERASEKIQLIMENSYLKEELKSIYKFDSIIGKSAKMKKVLETVEKVMNSPTTIIIYGESGTGKEVVARAIHENGPRRNKPFVKVSCAALPESVLESELFGHEKGAFTGAIQRRRGRFELADKGTLFLDEIGELSQRVQVKLLRVLQYKEFERVGGNRTINVDVRIIAATNRDLKKEVQEGRFREDLFYRLNVVPIFLPPLRERKEDIELLAQHFLKKFTKELSKGKKYFSSQVLRTFKNYTWPGNVRELENLVERLVVLSQNEVIDFEDLPAHMLKHQKELTILSSIFDSENEDIGLVEILEKVERQLIKSALKKHNYNQSRAANELKINRGALIYKLKKYGLIKT